MRHIEYDIKLAITIKAIRELKKIKQLVLAMALNVEQATYCRIEHGEIAITPGQLKIISKELRVSNFQILSIVELADLINMKQTYLPDLILKLVQMFEDGKIKNLLTSMEVKFIIGKIKERFST